MKKYDCPASLLSGRLLLKYLLLMKISVSLVLIFSFQAIAFNSSSQKRIDLDLKKNSIEEVLKKIEQRYDYNFVYNDEVKQSEVRVDIYARRATIDYVMQQLLKTTDFSYKKINNGLVVIIGQDNKASLLPITGKVIDMNGNPLAGVSIIEKGTTNGAVTKEDGSFNITVKDENAVLIVSNVGYNQQEVMVKNLTDADIILTPVDNRLDEVVVVGYGTQSKGKLLGSVATVDADKLENRPVTNVSSALAGLSSGVQVKQGSGQPGADGATIRVRGVSTMNNSEALVVIDGIVGVMDAVNPSDIETISILKDASSASIFGARAANGVILITTKKGKANQKPQVTYSGIFSKTAPTAMPRFVSDYVRHMELFNEGAFNLGQSAVYQTTTIDLWKKANADPNGLAPSGIPNYIAYPNTDWGKEIYTNYWLQNHNVSVTGGSDNVKYSASGRVLLNPGLMYNTGLKRYEFRTNLDIKVTDFLNVGTQTFGLTQNQDPGSVSNLYNFLRQTTPGIYPKYEDRFGGAVAPDESSQLNNLLLYLYGNGGTNQTSRFNSTVYANLKIIKGLSFETRVNYQTRFQEETGFAIPNARYNFADNSVVSPETTPANMTTSQSFNKNYTLTFDNTLRYNKAIDRHNFGLLLGHNEFYYKYYEFGASQRGLLDPTITNIGTATEMISISGSGTDNSMRSYFGRVNYDFDGKYLFEFNLRRDGSSKFGLDNQYGMFPSVALGWLLSREDFMQNVKPYFQDVKLRASWGKLGNDRTADYAWHGVFGTVNYSFGGSPVGALQLSRFGNTLLKWEQVENKEIGLEFATLRRRAFVELNYYNRLTSGILANAQVPITTGTTTAPIINFASMLNKGLEITVSWRDRIGDLRYNIGGNFSYNKNVVTQYKGKLQRGWITRDDGTKVYQTNLGDVSAGGVNRVLEDHLYNEFYVRRLYSGNGNYFNADGTVNITGGPQSGMIRTEKDLEWVNAMKAAGYSFSPVNTVGRAQLYYGDFIYADLNEDGIYGNSPDQEFTGTSTIPKYIYGFNFGVEYKGFDLQTIWAGEAKLQYYWNDEGYNNNIVRTGNHVAERVANDHYFYNPADAADPRTNLNGTFPRLKYNGESINSASSTFWLYDADFLKLRNVQLGYTFNSRLIQKAKMSSLRIYFSGENLLMFTKFPGLDPEIGSGAGYPTMKQFAFGVNVGF